MTNSLIKLGKTKRKGRFAPDAHWNLGMIGLWSGSRVLLRSQSQEPRGVSSSGLQEGSPVAGIKSLSRKIQRKSVDFADIPTSYFRIVWGFYGLWKTLRGYWTRYQSGVHFLRYIHGWQTLPDPPTHPPHWGVQPLPSTVFHSTVVPH